MDTHGQAFEARHGVVLVVKDDRAGVLILTSLESQGKKGKGGGSPHALEVYLNFPGQRRRIGE
jgi:hypothetical protein